MKQFSRSFFFDNLTEIVRGDGLKYVLQYNAFHNLESIGIDGKTDGKLITYTYKENNGRLKEMTYANGDKMTATYDGKGNMIAEKWYDASGNMTAYYKYGYSAQGEIVLSIDMLAKKMYNYTYENDRLEQSTESSFTFAFNSIANCETDFIGSKTLVCSVRYYYDNEGTLSKKRIVWADGNEQVITYTTAENESQLVKTELGEHSFVSTSKTDSFGRKEFDELQLGSGFVSRQFDYVSGEVTEEHKSENKLKSTPTTQLVSEITFQDGRTIDYEYDKEERITKVIDSVEGVTEYTYDSLGQLLTEVKNGELINAMTYDNYGNIKSKNGIDYSYNAVWKDRLSHYNSQEIFYDGQGNPINYLGHTLVWEKGRQLKSFDSSIFTYNANGIRTSKTVDGIRHDFYLDGGKILREVWLDNTLETVFDNEDSVCGIVYNGTPYYFMKNLQGDIIAITDKDGEVVARYTYDAWGKCEVDSSSRNAEIAHVNPFRYRGYYYDRETELYYLQSRYYDAEVGRFVNGDEVDYLGMSDLFLGYNLFTYCENAVSFKLDLGGNISLTIEDFKNDWAGREILKQYLFGAGKKHCYSSAKWAKYMMKAKMCLCSICKYEGKNSSKNNGKLTLENYINNYVKKFITPRKQLIITYISKKYNLKLHAAIKNGEGIIGYNYLHGTNGGLCLEINATYVKKDMISKKRAILISIKCTWNDKIDPNPKYATDIYKANIAKKILFANPKNYEIIILWNQYTKILL